MFLGSSGPYCPSQPSVSPYHSGDSNWLPAARERSAVLALRASKSNGPLIGAGGPSPGHGFTWLTDATGVYANPGRSFVWANVSTVLWAPNPFVYFAQEPAAIPFWKEDAPNDPANPIRP